MWTNRKLSSSRKYPLSHVHSPKSKSNSGGGGEQKFKFSMDGTMWNQTGIPSRGRGEEGRGGEVESKAF